MRDPYEISPQGSNQIIEFHSYRSYLPRESVLGILDSATFEALEHNREDLMGTTPIFLTEDGLEFSMIAEEGITWFMWTRALWGMRRTVQQEEMFFEWSFGIKLTEFGDAREMGNGILQDARRGGSASSTT